MKKENKPIIILAALLTLLITLPISLYITYTLLKIANVDRLVWFLFYINIPVQFLSTFIYRTITGD